MDYVWVHVFRAGLGDLCTLQAMLPTAAQSIFACACNFIRLAAVTLHSHAGLQASGAAAAVSVLLLHSYVVWPPLAMTGQWTVFACEVS
jgi:hypothetical protein